MAGMKYMRPVTVSQMPNRTIPRVLFNFILLSPF
jgi:hypothetical protein